MTFAEEVRAFELHLRAERNVSPHTRRAYLSDVAQLVDYVGEATSPAKVSIAEIRGFLAGFHARCQPATLGRKLAAIRSFFRFLVREKRCALDPTAGVVTPRIPKRRAHRRFGPERPRQDLARASQPDFRRPERPGIEHVASSGVVPRRQSQPHCCCISVENLEKLCNEAPEIAVKFLLAICQTFSARIRADNKRFQDTINFKTAAGR